MLEEFVQLYKVSPKIRELKSIDNQNYRAFCEKDGLPVAITNVQKFLEYIPYYPTLFPFFRRYPNFWIIPCDTPNGEIYGLVFRSFHGKGFRMVGKNRQIPQMLFGFHKFASFEYGEIIILVEGIKDCLYLQKFYPYVLSILTNSLSKDGYRIIRSLTNQVILALDNDVAGRRECKKLAKEFKERKVSTQEMLPYKEDWGEYFDDPSSNDAKGLLSLNLIESGG